jgi:hypothetical protein
VVWCVEKDEAEEDGSIGDRLDDEDGVFSNANVRALVLVDTDDGSTVRWRGGICARVRAGGWERGVEASLPSTRRSRRVEYRNERELDWGWGCRVTGGSDGDSRGEGEWGSG